MKRGPAGVLAAAFAAAIAGGCEHRDAVTVPAAASPAAAHAPMQVPDSVAAWAEGAQLFDGLGDYHRPVTTASPQAQRYFDQGMRLLWAFNHDESTRSFAKAAQLDPDCAACYWGVALTVGPNYNLPYTAPVRAKVAAEALALAREHASRGSPVEQSLIEALASRYPGAGALDPAGEGPVLKAYAEKMQAVAARFPDDLDVQTLSAEALMNTNAWKLWTADGKPAPGTLRIEAILEAVLAKQPRHPGANHYYAHVMEASPHPEVALASAQRLAGMMPASGHLEHMPAHIYQRLGRYDEAAQANRSGARADGDYLRRTRAPDYYELMYTGHNYQFLAWSTAMQGRRADTLEAVGQSRRATDEALLLAMPGMDWPLAEEYAALLRFGLWDDMLARPAPDPRHEALAGGYLYGRGVALAAKGRIAEARASLDQLNALISRLAPDAGAGLNSARDVLALGAVMVQARIASAEARGNDAIALLREAVRREDALAYNEPADWFLPARHVLGAQLLAAGRTAEAEAVYRRDLELHPANGWALRGLADALRRGGRADEAGEVERQFAAAWQNADTSILASAF